MKHDTRVQMRELAEAPVNKHGFVGRPDEVDPAAAKKLLTVAKKFHEELAAAKAKLVPVEKAFNSAIEALHLPKPQSAGDPFHAVAVMRDGHSEDVGGLDYDQRLVMLRRVIDELSKVAK